MRTLIDSLADKGRNEVRKTINRAVDLIMAKGVD
jgi:hypothetical protein